MSFARIASHFYLGLAIYSVVINDMVLFGISVIASIILGIKADMQILEKDVQDLKEKDETDR